MRRLLRQAGGICSVSANSGKLCASALTYVNALAHNFNIIYQKVVQEMEIRAFYRDALGVRDPQLLTMLEENSHVVQVDKGQKVLDFGEICTEILFLASGIFRGYFLDARGRDVTDCFGVLPGMPALPCSGFEKPSPICIEVLEDSEFVAIPIRALLPHLTASMELMSIYNMLLQESLKEHWENKIALGQYSAAERYQWFLKSYPGLIDRVPHRDVASFLGMTPVSLSRIRRELRDKGEV